MFLVLLALSLVMASKVTPADDEPPQCSQTSTDDSGDDDGDDDDDDDEPCVPPLEKQDDGEEPQPLSVDGALDEGDDGETSPLARTYTVLIIGL